MNKKNIQAFTLMELLAVLVILAIIALIVFPIIGDVITDSKMKAFKSSVDGLEHAVDLDYQKDYYKGEREYSYEDGNLTLNSVKGESKNKNIKVEGIIENGAGTVSVDKTGNTSLIIYNDEYCAVKDYSDKTITIEEKTERNCMIPTPAYCFETVEAIIVESYDINLENCKATLSDSSLSEEDKTAFCTKGQTTSDGQSLEKMIGEGPIVPEIINSIIEENVIENAVTKKINVIKDYKCYEGNTYGYETITDVVIPSKINGIYTSEIGQNAFRRKNLTSVIIPTGITTLGRESFYSNQLTEVYIPGTVTTIGEHAFGCQNPEITYENKENITSNLDDMYWCG